MNLCDESKFPAFGIIYSERQKKTTIYKLFLNYLFPSPLLRFWKYCAPVHSVNHFEIQKLYGTYKGAYDIFCVQTVLNKYQNKHLIKTDFGKKKKYLPIHASSKAKIQLNTKTFTITILIVRKFIFKTKKFETISLLWWTSGTVSSKWNQCWNKVSFLRWIITSLSLCNLKPYLTQATTAKGVTTFTTIRYNIIYSS